RKEPRGPIAVHGISHEWATPSIATLIATLDERYAMVVTTTPLHYVENGFLRWCEFCTDSTDIERLACGATRPSRKLMLAPTVSGCSVLGKPCTHVFHAYRSATGPYMANTACP